MSSIDKCLLCKGDLNLFSDFKNKRYYQCTNCLSIMLDPLNYLSALEEKLRYQTHNNDVNDPRYQNFVSPIVESVKANYQPKDLGLDFGSGTGPVIPRLLEKAGYKLKLYDPYFHNEPRNLNLDYDYVVCCEVMEHFYNPYQEFKKISNLLKPKGSIYCMTCLYDENIDFDNWYYKNDDTHVFFYHHKALDWIKVNFGFSEVKVEGRLITFKK